MAALALGSTQRTVASDDDYDDPPDRVARLSELRGPVSFQPAGEPDWVTAVANRPLTAGDRLWTDPGARAELSTGSATIRVAGSTDLAFINLDDHVLQLQLTYGTVTLRVLRLRPKEVVEVDTPNQAFSVLEPGSYRLEVSEDGDSTLVTVRAGEGEAFADGETYTVRQGQATRFGGTGRLAATAVGLRPLDDLDEWGLRRDRRAAESRSARYVSRDVVGYEDLDDNGTWDRDQRYGDVWFPTRVEAGWAPYHDGHWAWIAPWGYTWVDDAAWGYAPFHYGRWVTVRGRWGWIPGPVEEEAVYAPALVAFIGGPGFELSVAVGGGSAPDAVGWFPLGPREVYVPGYHVSPRYVNRINVSNTTVTSTTVTTVYNTQITNPRSTTTVYVNRAAPGGATFVPRQAFTSAQPVARAAVKVDAQRLAAAPVGPRVAAAPTRSAVLGAAPSERAPRPPTAIAARAVVNRAPAPPPPVPFARQQRALEAHPGQPLLRREVESVRPAAVAPASAGAPEAPRPARQAEAPAAGAQPPAAAPPKREPQAGGAQRPLADPPRASPVAEPAARPAVPAVPVPPVAPEPRRNPQAGAEQRRPLAVQPPASPVAVPAGRAAPVVAPAPRAPAASDGAHPQAAARPPATDPRASRLGPARPGAPVAQPAAPKAPAPEARRSEQQARASAASAVPPPRPPRSEKEQREADRAADEERPHR